MRLIKNSYFPSLLNDIFSDDLVNTGTAVAITKPAVNIKESDKAFEIEMAIPGVDKKDFVIEVKENILTLSGGKESKKEEEKILGFSRREFSFSSFKRSFVLPETVDSEKINATYKDGILTLDIPKKEEAKMQPRKIIVG